MKNELEKESLVSAQTGNYRYLQKKQSLCLKSNTEFAIFNFTQDLNQRIQSFISMAICTLSKTYS